MTSLHVLLKQNLLIPRQDRFDRTSTWDPEWKVLLMHWFWKIFSSHEKLKKDWTAWRSGGGGGGDVGGGCTLILPKIVYYSIPVSEVTPDKIFREARNKTKHKSFAWIVPPATTHPPPPPPSPWYAYDEQSCSCYSLLCSVPTWFYEELSLPTVWGSYLGNPGNVQKVSIKVSTPRGGDKWMSDELALFLSFLFVLVSSEVSRVRCSVDDNTPTHYNLAQEGKTRCWSPSPPPPHYDT